MKITKVFEIWRENSEGKYEHCGACVRVLYDVDKHKFKFTFKDDNKKFVKFENVKSNMFRKDYDIFSEGMLCPDFTDLYRGVIMDILQDIREIVDDRWGLRLELVELRKNWGYTL